MNIKRSQVASGVVLELTGRLDAEAGNELVSQVTEQASSGTHITLDLRGVPFVNSAGLASLITSLKRCRERGATLRLMALQPQVQEVFELTQLSYVFGMNQQEERAA